MVSIGDSRNGVFGRVEGEVKRRTLNKDKKSASNLQSETVEDVTVDVENVEGAKSATGRNKAQQPFHSYTFLRMNELPKHVLYSGNIIDSCIKEDVLGDVVREILRKHTASRIIRADVNEATNYLWTNTKTYSFFSSLGNKFWVFCGNVVPFKSYFLEMGVLS
uniref:Uncharacterized protein n=1 Tax=Rhizophagus irregularis (strain DAOM 181602 / DAOM 197198 / MUCL 43194) TaxID=747089 RepID=U9TAE1_RHIID